MMMATMAMMMTMIGGGSEETSRFKAGKEVEVPFVHTVKSAVFGKEGKKRVARVRSKLFISPARFPSSSCLFFVFFGPERC